LNKIQTVIISSLILIIIVLTLIVILYPFEYQSSWSEYEAIWNEEEGVRLTIIPSKQNIKIGEPLNYTVELRNVNSPHRLYLYQSTGTTTTKILDENGAIVKSRTGRYAWGPPGQPEESFLKGSIWTVNDPWELNLPSGSFTLHIKATYGVIDQESKSIEVSMPFNITKQEEITDNSNGFSSKVTSISKYSLQVTILEYSANQSLVLNNSDPKFEVLLQHLNNSSLLRTMLKTRTVVEGNRTTTTSVTVPYSWGIILTFELDDGSTLRFNCAQDDIWFETEQAIYQASFDPAFNIFLNIVLQESLETSSIDEKSSEKVRSQVDIIYLAIGLIVITILTVAILIQRRKSSAKGL
jgi:hypothetical protein